jgi:hypothetical protein
MRFTPEQKAHIDALILRRLDCAERRHNRELRDQRMRLEAEIVRLRSRTFSARLRPLLWFI